MGNKASEEMMIVDDSELVQPVKSVAEASNQDSMLEQLDKFIHHRKFSSHELTQTTCANLKYLVSLRIHYGCNR